MKRKSLIGRGGVWTLNISKRTPTLNQKKPTCPSTGKARVCRGSEPSTSFPATKIQKGHVTSLSSPLASLHHKPLSLCPSIFWQTHPEHTLPLSLHLLFLYTANPSFSLSLKAFFWQTHPEQQKNNHTYKNIVVRNPWWFRKHAESACWRMSILGVGCDSFFSQWFFSFREKNIKVLLKK